MIMVLLNNNDEFAKNFSEFETLADYKKDIKKTLKAGKDEQSKIEVENELIGKVTDNATVEVPEIMIADQIDAFIKDFEYKLMYQGLKFEDYLKATGVSLEEFRTTKREDATKTVKTRLTIETIIKAEKFEVKPEEFDAKIAEMATKENQPVKEFEKTLTREKVDYVVNDLMVNKVLDFLRKENNIA